MAVHVYMSIDIEEPIGKLDRKVHHAWAEELWADPSRKLSHLHSYRYFVSFLDQLLHIQNLLLDPDGHGCGRRVF